MISWCYLSVFRIPKKRGDDAILNVLPQSPWLWKNEKGSQQYGCSLKIWIHRRIALFLRAFKRYLMNHLDVVSLRLLSLGGLTLLSGFSLSRPFLLSLRHFFFWYFFLSWQTKCFLLFWYVKFSLPSKISCDNENSISTASSGLYQYPSVGSEHCPKFCR